MQIRAYFDMFARMFQPLGAMQSNIMRNFVVVFVAFAAFALAPAVARTPSDTQLVMMEEAGCSWCERWLAEIGVVYDRTKEGRIAPLRRVDVHEPLPGDLRFLKPAFFTPTFILVTQGREIGRIQGYPGEDFFWSLLGELLEKLPKAENLKVDAKL